MRKKVFFIGLLILSAVSVCSYGQELERKRKFSGYGFIDKSTGEIVIPYRYFETKDFSEGLAAVRFSNSKWGFIDKTGIVVIPFKYRQVENFSEGFAPVLIYKLWGAIDKTGTVVVPYIYETSRTVKNILADMEKKESKETFSYFVLNYVEQEINKWAQRGEFERTSDWEQRVNEDSRKAKSAELFKDAERVYITEHSKNMPVGNITLGAYNADIEVFIINNDLYGDWLAAVPIHEAPDFRNNWNNILKTPQWVISNDRIAFAGYKFSVLDAAVATKQKEIQTIQTVETKQSEQVKATQNTADKSQPKTKFGLQGGVNFSHGGYLNLFGSNLGEHYIKAKPGFQIGFIIDMPFRNPRFGYQPIISFFQLGVETGYEGYNPWKSELNMNFLQARNNFRYNLGQNNTTLSLNTGLYVNYMLSYKQIDDGKAVESNFTANASASDFGIGLGAALLLGGIVQIDAGYNIGIKTKYTAVNLTLFFGN